MAKKAVIALAEGPKVLRYGFYHNAAECNAAIDVANCVDDTFFVVFDGTFTGENYLVDVEIEGYTYSAIVTDSPTTHTKLYWRLGPSKDDTGFDFVDKKPVAEATETWPTVSATPIEATMTVSTFEGNGETYPATSKVVMGVDDKPIAGVSVSIDTKTPADNPITPKEDEMPDNTMTPEVAVEGCPFDSGTAKAIHGKKLLVLVLDQTKSKLVGFSGQQDATFTVEAETTESNTKDGNGEWVTKNAGQKSWNSSVNGIWPVEDEGQSIIVKALKSGGLLCEGLYIREEQDDGRIKYTPVRKGLAYVTSNEISAPSDDNVTYSINFEGTGELWMSESATQEEIDAMTFYVDQPL